MKITNDAEYFKVLERIVKGAEYVDNPLIKDEEKAKGAQLYDQLCETARAYRETDRV